MTRERRKSLYVKNEDANLDKETKKETTKANYAKRRSPRAERLSEKLTDETKPVAVETKAESTLPKNLDKSMSHENKKEVSAKKKLDKSNSQKVKKSTGADSTKYAYLRRYCFPAIGLLGHRFLVFDLLQKRLHRQLGILRSFVLWRELSGRNLC